MSNIPEWVQFGLKAFVTAMLIYDAVVIWRLRERVRELEDELEERHDPS